MLPPIVCNCGLPICDIARKFIEMRNKLVKEKSKDISSKTDPNNVIYLSRTEDNKEGLNLEPIFEALGNPPLCCRIQLSTNMLFKEHY